MNGTLIVIEGLDGSGKATQSERLYAHIAAAGRPARKVSFPNYDSPSSALVRMYLAGEFGTDPDAVNPYAASSFYACDRYAGYKSVWGEDYRNGSILIADRYTTSNAIHQCAKLPQEQWDGFLHWLFSYEYELLGIPAPKQVFYLRVDPDVSQRLMSERYGHDESKKDIHESNLAYLRRSREAADYCAAALGWDVIECTAAGEMRSIDAIFADIVEKLSL